MNDERRRPRAWPRVTMKDVAREANVSDATVSRVLDGASTVSAEARSAVMEAVRRTGYIRNGAASQLAGSRSDVLGLLIRDVANPYYGLMHSELQRGVADRGLRLLTVSPTFTQDFHEEVIGLDHLLEQRVRGLLIATGTLPLERAAAFAAFVPMVVLGRPTDLGDVHSIAYDERANGYLAADEVLARGHRDVAVVATASEASFVENARSEAMIERLGAGGARPVPVPRDAQTPMSAVIAGIEALTREKRVTAAMFPSDGSLLAFLEAVQHSDLRVPEDLSVTGVDGVLPGISLLGLSTVRLPVEGISARGVEVMAAQLDGTGDDAPVREVLPATFLAGRTLVPVDGRAAR
ncbi:LacI family transcriptional regulator [Microbacterium esteraromaticum]|uniref:LacI family DNA-binding transcriptional regulator n=1 Tax=Microbacterium esteraromaticum TaxID=57043 RepID=UPI001CD68A31|nr:LacI family DNA-binding transcriptional regulator [Microbacterium esteraromaticum]MCA1306915.1 LacI family transcriptional regulator [Microbacterium esteraromaticum]